MLVFQEQTVQWYGQTQMASNELTRLPRFVSCWVQIRITPGSFLEHSLLQTQPKSGGSLYWILMSIL